MATKILIIRFSSIGDIVLTTPVVRAAKQQLDGDVEVHYLTKSAFASVLDGNPYIDRVWELKEDVNVLIASLKQEHFDYVIDLHKNIRSGKVKNHLKTLTFSFEKLNWEKWLLVNFGIDNMPDIHIVDRYMAAGKSFGLVDDGQGLDYFIPEREVVDITRYSASLANGYVAWVLGAAHEGKRFSLEKNISLLSKIDMSVILIGGPNEVEMSKTIDKSLGENIFNLCGQLTLHGSASIIKQARAVVTPDTGMMHIASAFQKNIISVWGCTVPQLGMYPYRPGEGSVMIQPVGLTKRPCSKLGDRCKYKGFCINQIPEEDVLNAISVLVEKTSLKE